MNCVKCGRETVEEQVFCDVCLGEMESYPVKPGTAIHIPTRNPVEETKKSQPRRKTTLPLSEQVLRLKKKVLRLRIVLVLLLLICGFLSYLVGQLSGMVNLKPLPGQNYHTEETAGQTETETP